MHILIQKQVSPDHPRPFWACTVHSSNGRYVTLLDVLENLYRALKTNISQAEFESLSDTDRRRATRAYEERYRRLRDIDPRASDREKKGGMKRIDFQMGRKRFGGLVEGPHHEEFVLQVT
jgi:hypothetical protein